MYPILVEYLCKWKGLLYSDSTWEDHDSVSTYAQDEIDAFLARSATAKLPHRSAHYGKARPQFTKLIEQPDYISKTGKELKDFQMTGLNWLAYIWCRGENGILADEVC